MTDEKSETPEVKDVAPPEDSEDGKAGEPADGSRAIDEAQLEDISGGSSFGWWNEPTSN